ncbi:hypothetical protein RHGRI_021612 [Rhododendron griersonianum]|uniref:Probable glutathione S-transferase n=1 Tax=Rhododendron griersonianum TaxID=479676 RepID=A0AAV6JPB1_9ERIC|nr:hypothetical protein RHGRI_021612 [Rhododendron griersonianum]
MAAGEGVKLIGCLVSPLALRVEWALKLKGIEYEYVDEDLSNKSALLLQCNPVHKKIPVLVHDGKPVAESLVIIEYVDEVWKERYPLLPRDPSERAKARFWAKFVDEKCVPALIAIFSKQGEEQEKSAKEAQEILKTLESGLEGKPFFGGETIGFVDISAAWIEIWAKITEEIVNIKLVDEESMPLLCVWFEHVLENPIIKECLPPREKLLEHIKGVHRRLG